MSSRSWTPWSNSCRPDLIISGRPVGVAIDARGNVAAATSTGGITAKRWGRVGDSPLIGAGTYADNATCAVSATGRGEYFMRKVLAYDIAARIKYRGQSLEAACNDLIHGECQGAGKVPRKLSVLALVRIPD